MSREIKFRTWSKLYKQWCGGTNYIDGVWLGWICRYGKDIMTQDVVLEQYTGLKDKNGKEIYEGDIIRLYDRFVSVITWQDDYCGFRWYDNSGDGYCGLGKDSEEYYEVIGNIHENPELLKGK